MMNRWTLGKDVTLIDGLKMDVTRFMVQKRSKNAPFRQNGRIDGLKTGRDHFFRLFRNPQERKYFQN